SPLTDCRDFAGRFLQEVLALFIAIKSAKYKAILAISYGAGLRVSEVCALKPTDIDSQRMLIHVRRGKGNSGRYVLLSETTLTHFPQREVNEGQNSVIFFGKV
ncbi:MAG: tyrosine-type recombinase/integrase, partial [Deltaproteobacteria bacterium]|nr:tyrosine-type recombinase/integrase [Deltaproteobacteria bacterium]